LKNFEYKDICELVDAGGLIVVTSHHHPDGDAVGSALALAILLQNAGKDAVCMVPNDFPLFLKWLPGNELIVIHENDSERADSLLHRADLIFCLDYNALHRTGKMETALGESKAKKVLIDHHPEPLIDEFDYYLSETQVSSTAELLYRFMEGCGWLALIDQRVATGLFVGIMTDTGSFSFSCNSPETWRNTAALIAAGIDAEQIHRRVYDTYSTDRLRLLGYCLSEKLTIIPGLSTAYIALSKEELDRFNHQVGDTEGIVNYALSIENVKIAIFITERDDRIRLSFRSKGNFQVNRVAREHFGGGGHKNAAGGDSYTSLEETISKLQDILSHYRDEIERSTF
jgi:phosphoesterase RecJ-like protein